MGQVVTFGLDIAKSVFQVHGVDGVGEVVVRHRRLGQQDRTDGLGDYDQRRKLPRAGAPRRLDIGALAPSSLERAMTD
jgi:hypothetical protein